MWATCFAGCPTTAILVTRGRDRVTAIGVMTCATPTYKVIRRLHHVCLYNIQAISLPVVVDGCNDRLTVAFSNPLGKLNTTVQEKVNIRKKGGK